MSVRHQLKFSICLVFLFLPMRLLYAQFPLYYSQTDNNLCDGSMDDWPAVIPAVIESDSQVTLGDRVDPSYLGAKFYLYFTQSTLNLFAEVTDNTPLENPFPVKDIYKGDSFALYISWDRNNSNISYGIHDYQLYFGFYGTMPVTLLNNNQIENQITPPPLNIAYTEKGYIVETIIPLDLFRIEKCEPDRLIQLEFQINSFSPNQEELSMFWHTQGEGWAIPGTWASCQITENRYILEGIHVLHPPILYTHSKNKIVIYEKALPYQGPVLFDNKIIETAGDGSLELHKEIPKKYLLQIKSGTSEYETKIKVVTPYEEMQGVQAVQKIMSLIFIPLLILLFCFIYISRTRKSSFRF